MVLKHVSVTGPRKDTMMLPAARTSDARQDGSIPDSDPIEPHVGVRWFGSPG